MMKKIINIYWPLFFVAVITAFNFILLYPETTIKMDLNDNVFAYTLVRETNNMVGNFLNLPSWANFVLIFDHWVPQWGLGYPLPHFYQHIPNLAVVIFYRLISLIAQISLLTIFNWTKYLMLSFVPLVFYYSARKFDFSRLAASASALVSALISTNYLYGTDYNALVFRGSGMYTQLWGIFFLPLALSSVYYCLKSGQGYLKAVIFLALSLASHLVFGYLAVLSTPLLLFCLIVELLFSRHSGNERSEDSRIISGRFWTSQNDVVREAFSYIKRLFLILSFTFLLLSYWLIPLILDSNYQNKSVWDDFTKFNSYGWEQILKWLVNGEIFDYGRLPVLTILVAIGFFWALYKFSTNLSLRGRSEATDEAISIMSSRHSGEPEGRLQNPTKNDSGQARMTIDIDSRWRGNDNFGVYLFFPLLFLFWLILYFGRFTWGPFFDLLPLSEGLHGQRLINGVHFAGIFLIGLAIEWLATRASVILGSPDATSGRLQNLTKRGSGQVFRPRAQDREARMTKLSAFSLILLIPLIFLLLFTAFKERSDYLSWNNYLIGYFNREYAREWPDFAKVLQKINQLGKARINLGRPGNWGRNFTVGGFSAYFVASVNGFDTIGFLPESWSLHSDIEQFFSENDPNYYDLFNVRYIIAPPDQKFGTFAQKVDQYGKFVLYKVKTKGNFSFINSDILISATKKQKINLDRFWIGSKLMPQQEFPTVSFAGYNNYKDYKNYKLTLTMTDWANYQIVQPTQTKDLNFFATNPFDSFNTLIPKYSNISSPSGQVLSQTSGPNYFSAKVSTPEESTLLLRATYHPFWQAFIDGQPVNTFMVEPAMTAIKVPKGNHLVEFKYYARVYKQILILVSLLTLPGLYFFLTTKKRLLD